jgi:hypothetical protein
MGLEMRKLELALIFNWVSQALKTLDHIVIHYIRDYLKEPFNAIGTHGVETSRYMQLASKQQPLAMAANLLKDLYSIHRNAHEHRTSFTPDGSLIYRPPDKSKCRRDAINYFHKACKGFLETYKTAYPQYVIA